MSRFSKHFYFQPDKEVKYKKTSRLHIQLPPQIRALISEIVDGEPISQPRCQKAVIPSALKITDPKKIRKCPVCDNFLELYLIDVKKKFLMCSNDYCDYPLGYEAIQIVRDQSQLLDNPEPLTGSFWDYPPIDHPLLHSESDHELSVVLEKLYKMTPYFLLDTETMKETTSAKLSKQSKELNAEKIQKQDPVDILLSKKVKEQLNLKEPEESKICLNRRKKIFHKDGLSNLVRYGNIKNVPKFLIKKKLKKFKQEQFGNTAEELVVSNDKMAPTDAKDTTKKRMSK